MKLRLDKTYLLPILLSLNSFRLSTQDDDGTTTARSSQATSSSATIAKASSLSTANLSKKDIVVTNTLQISDSRLSSRIDASSASALDISPSSFLKDNLDSSDASPLIPSILPSSSILASTTYLSIDKDISTTTIKLETGTLDTPGQYQTLSYLDYPTVSPAQSLATSFSLDSTLIASIPLSAGYTSIANEESSFSTISNLPSSQIGSSAPISSTVQTSSSILSPHVSAVTTSPSAPVTSSSVITTRPQPTVPTSTSPVITIRPTTPITKPETGERGESKGMSSGGQAALAIFIVLLVAAMIVVGVIMYRRRMTHGLGGRFGSSVAYRRYTDDEGINMGIYGK